MDIPENTADDVLRIKIVGVNAGEEGTGGFAVAKSVTAAGTLTRNGQVIGSFTAFRYSGGSESANAPGSGLRSRGWAGTSPNGSETRK